MSQYNPWPQDETAIINKLNNIVEDLQMAFDAGKDPRIPASFKNFANDDDSEPDSGLDSSGPRLRR